MSTRPLRIGWYVHHQGAGHARRARAVAGELAARGHAVTVLSSLAPQGFCAWETLPRDDEGPIVDPSPGGALHWAPLAPSGYADRMARIAAWIAAERPDVVVVDVSCEVVVLARTLGVPVVTAVLPGDRTDRPHETALRLATRVFAAFPAEAASAVGVDVCGDRLAYVGGVSLLTSPVGEHPSPGGEVRSPVGEGRHAVVLVGRGSGRDVGGVSLPDVPGWRWTVAGPGAWTDDVAGLLRGADVVVCGAGQGTIADVAAVGVPAIVVPEPRPHDEQAATGAALARMGLATVLPALPTGADAWRAALEEAAASRPDWSRWRTAGAASRVADVIEAAA